MIHLNPEERRTFGLAHIFQPQKYIASTLGDFVNKRGEIVTSTSVFPPGIWYYGRAIVYVPMLTYHIRPDGNYVADLSDSLKVEDGMMSSKHAKELEDMARMFNIVFVYTPKIDRRFFPKKERIVIKSFSTQGPEGKEKARYRERPGDIVQIPGMA